jgi:hypothetical protein
MEGKAIVEKALEAKFEKMKKELSSGFTMVGGVMTDWVQAFDLMDFFDDAHGAQACMEEAHEAFEKGRLAIPEGCTVKWIPNKPSSGFQIEFNSADYIDGSLSVRKLKGLCKENGIDIA